MHPIHCKIAYSRAFYFKEIENRMKNFKQNSCGFTVNLYFFFCKKRWHLGEKSGLAPGIFSLSTPVNVFSKPVYPLLRLYQTLISLKIEYIPARFYGWKQLKMSIVFSHINMASLQPWHFHL